jgi:hypothetical protein
VLLRVARGGSGCTGALALGRGGRLPLGGGGGALLELVDLQLRRRAPLPRQRVLPRRALRRTLPLLRRTLPLLHGGTGGFGVFGHTVSLGGDGGAPRLRLGNSPAGLKPAPSTS